MPNMKEIEADPDFSPENAEERALWMALKKKKPIKMSEVQALENVKNSRGMYRIVPPPAPVVSVEMTSLNTASNEELKIMASSFGISLQKRVKRSDLINLITARAAKVEVIDEDVTPDT